MSHELPGEEPAELLRQLADELPVGTPEDSSAARRDRLVQGMSLVVERSFEHAKRRERFLRRLLVSSAAASILLLSGVVLRPRFLSESSPVLAGLDSVVGTVVLTQQGVRRVVGAGSQALWDGDALQTAAAAGAHIGTAKSSVKLGESTELELSSPSAAEERISLRRGRIDVAVNKDTLPQRVVVVETPDVEVVVRGTVFDVRVEPRGERSVTHVHVARGSVWVLAQSVQVALLSAGQSWNSESALVGVPAPVEAAEGAELPVAPPAAGSVPSVAKEAVGLRKLGTLAEENRLFAAAIEARNRGDEGRAAEFFGQLLATYPRSALREAAQVERFRAFGRAGQAARAATEARRYLAEHSDGFARGEARGLALDRTKP